MHCPSRGLRKPLRRALSKGHSREKQNKAKAHRRVAIPEVLGAALPEPSHMLAAAQPPGKPRWDDTVGSTVYASLTLATLLSWSWGRGSLTLYSLHKKKAHPCLSVAPKRGEIRLQSDGRRVLNEEAKEITEDPDKEGGESLG